MQIFLTGGSGYLGTATIAALRRAGHTVTALARNEAAASAVTAAGATSVPGGLGDLDTLRSAAGRADAVIHLAQADGAADDLAAAHAMIDGVGGGTYVHTGGSWVYGDTRGIVDETATWNPPPIVAWRHAAETEILKRAGRPVIIRPGLVYGGQNRLIDYFFTRPGVERGAIPYIGDGANHWALVHIEDIAALYVAALRAPAGSVYLGVGEVFPTASEAATALSAGAGLDGKVESITLDEARRRMGGVADAFALDQQFTPARARSDLGWSPAHQDPLAVLRATRRP